MKQNSLVLNNQNTLNWKSMFHCESAFQRNENHRSIRLLGTDKWIVFHLEHKPFLQSVFCTCSLMKHQNRKNHENVLKHNSCHPNNIHCSNHDGNRTFLHLTSKDSYIYPKLFDTAEAWNHYILWIQYNWLCMISLQLKKKRQFKRN